MQYSLRQKSPKRSVSLKVGNLLNAGRRVFKDVSEGEWPEAELSKLRVIEGVDADKTLLFSYAKVGLSYSLPSH